MEVRVRVWTEGEYIYAGGEKETSNYSNTANNGSPCLDPGVGVRICVCVYLSLLCVVR